MKIIKILVIAAFLGLTACGDSSTNDSNASSNLFGNLEISCDSESCL